MYRYNKKTLNKIAAEHVREIKASRPVGYRHCVKLYDWEIVFNSDNTVYMAVLFNDHTGLRQNNIAI